MKGLAKVAGSVMGVGFIPWIPGTWGSVPGLALAWFLSDAQLLLAIGILCVTGFVSAVFAREAFQEKDPKAFVLDETCGMMISALWLEKSTPFYLSAFILFRLLDWLKPWPIRVFDRMKGASGIMWDDIAAGLLVNLLLRVFISII
jgi:phosphatidylglycerophosphatase A